MGRVADWMHKMVSFRGALAGLIGLFLIGALGFMSLSLMKRETQRIVDDTLPGLSTAGAANANLAQAFTRTVLFVMAEDPNQRAKLRDEIDAFTRQTTAYLDAYKGQIASPTDRAKFDQLVQCRDDYFKIREKTLMLVENARHEDATAACNAELLPAYQRYHEAGLDLLQYNIQLGKSRSDRIMLVCTLTQFVVAGAAVLVFVVGFFIGLFK